MMTLLDILAENHPGKQKSRLRQNSDRTPKEPQGALGGSQQKEVEPAVGDVVLTLFV